MPPAAVDPALVEAKKTLAKTCDALTSRSTFFPIFDESKGSVDYARWRRDLFTFVSSSGADFTAALEFAGPITPTVRYDGINLVNSDSTCITAAAEFGYSFTDVVSDPDIAAGCVVMDGATSVFWNSYYSE